MGGYCFYLQYLLLQLSALVVVVCYVFSGLTKRKNICILVVSANDRSQYYYRRGS